MPVRVSSQKKQRIIKNAYKLIVSNRLSNVSMDDLINQSGVSKATMYKYFGNKEDIIKSIVDMMITHLEEVIISRPSENIAFEEYLKVLNEAFIQAIEIGTTVSDGFLEELSLQYPESFDRYRIKLQEYEFSIIKIYQNGMKNGYFNDIQASILIEEIKSTIPRIINREFLFERRLTIERALNDYYKMILSQALTKQYYDRVTQKMVNELIEAILLKLQS